MRLWAVMVTVAALLAISAVALAVLPLGSAADDGARQACAPGIVSYLPSDPLPTADPHYAVSERCHRRSVQAGGVTCLTGVAALVLGVLGLVLARRRRRWPVEHHA